MQFMQHFPYIDSLWFGEGYDYDAPPEYWLLEVSGLPFGLMGDMMHARHGQNGRSWLDDHGCLGGGVSGHHQLLRRRSIEGPGLLNALREAVPSAAQPLPFPPCVHFEPHAGTRATRGAACSSA